MPGPLCSAEPSSATMRAGYPEAYFARLALPAEAVLAVVAACRSDDVYHQVRVCMVGPKQALLLEGS
jgi:hypothetical protein